MTTIFGLIGRDIAHSFSAQYFADKFKNEDIHNCLYKNFDIPEIAYLSEVIKKNRPMRGLNVTIPYKEVVIPYLDKLSKKAEAIGAVNTIKVTKQGKLKGYNTDAYGFEKSLKPLLKPHHTKALILGTGGASKAVAWVLDKLCIDYKYVSRTPTDSNLSYLDANEQTLKEYKLIINCTPLGTSPNTEAFPKIDYNGFSAEHIAFDLIYNPSETKFLALAKEKGALTKNGYDMLVFQAEKAWEIWR